MDFDISSPFYLILPLALMSLIPFVAVLGTSFLKLVVVFGILRNATGLQQIPPNMALNSLAIILTIYIMAPIGIEAYKTLEQSQQEISLEDDSWKFAFEASAEPYRKFLAKNTTERERKFFLKTARALWPPEYQEELAVDSLMIMIPAFALGELTKAFQVGFLLYLPFIIIDLIVSNILLAMGMMMVSPMTISLPFKLLLFVLLDGWTKLVHGLVLSYQ
ncbi:type III secretion system export apparatus subunit SctR [Sansalvadorimonas sp. 2012CJ34-2]|uniref:Type III secretion system export apparatus subunit SctR n=1 Tax=Parendozoicomonas callyspongiae TaxID=2942213 RepID=A0ABT0PJY8_9GAMM|nr:type III secretion system export apparatus subunit SctR [Sansalvadorimonas sp. 2012CJ34-2]MCL6271704.1 type III secretion system export apparatus subunit SctR [Sansalvadorimonas sp. 2012CJ34-2]